MFFSFLLSFYNVRIYCIAVNSQGTDVSAAATKQMLLLSLTAPAGADTGLFTPVLTANADSHVTYYIPHSKHTHTFMLQKNYKRLEK